MSQPNVWTSPFLGSPCEGACGRRLYRIDYEVPRSSKLFHDEGAKRWDVGTFLQDTLGSRGLGKWGTCYSMKGRVTPWDHHLTFAACTQYLRATAELDDLERFANGPERSTENPG